MFVGDREHVCVAPDRCRSFPRDQSMHFENTTACKWRKIRITRYEKSRFYPVLAKIRIKKCG